MSKLEICANSVASCIAAERGGADRVELCVGVADGGITPSYGEIAIARANISIGLNVLIRPRGGDFIYSTIEVKTMLHDIEMVRRLGADGVVIGALNPNGTVNMPICRELIEAAAGMSITFHRSFDMCKSPMEALEQIVELGCDRILTSGASFTAEDGIPVISSLVKAAGNRVIIMPGGGIRQHNILRIASETGANEFHTSARTLVSSQMQYRNLNVAMGGNSNADEYVTEVTDENKVSQIVDILNKY